MNIFVKAKLKSINSPHPLNELMLVNGTLTKPKKPITPKLTLKSHIFIDNEQ